jgi:hypothetical protein
MVDLRKNQNFIAVRSFSHRSLPRVRFSRDLNLKFEF